jgi:hypothetical protein
MKGSCLGALFTIDVDYSSLVYFSQHTEPEFVNLLRSPGIDSQPGGPVRQPHLTDRPAKLQRLAGSIPGLLKHLQIRVLLYVHATPRIPLGLRMHAGVSKFPLDRHKFKRYMAKPHSQLTKYNPKLFL